MSQLSLSALTRGKGRNYGPRLLFGPWKGPYACHEIAMKVRNSLKSLKARDKDCRVIRRKGRVYIINKKNPRFKARQG